MQGQEKNSATNKEQQLCRHFFLGEHLLQRKIITISQLAEALNEQQKTGRLIGEIFVLKGYLTSEDLNETLKWQSRIDSMVSFLSEETKSQFTIKTVEL